MTELIDRLRDRGWRLTAQRRVIAEVFTGEHVHLTADEVHDRAKTSLPEVSLATVYNTLNELVAIGEILEVNVDHGKKRYDPNVAEDHQHLVCTVCGDVYDVKLAKAPALTEAERHGFVIDGTEVTFLGRCATCQDA